MTPAHNVAPRQWGQSGCTIRTDYPRRRLRLLRGVPEPEKVGLPPRGTHFLVKSFDGGASWTKPMALASVVGPCFALIFDGSPLRCVEDGVAGARNDLAAAPSVSIANGAPTGAGRDESDRRRMGGRARRPEQRARDVHLVDRRRTTRHLVGAAGDRDRAGRPRPLCRTGDLAHRRRRLGRLQRVHDAVP